jgi:uncharacterized protein (TIGR02172 family)
MRKIGEGRTAVIYELAEGQVLKLYNGHIPYEAVKNEFTITQTINNLHIPSPKAYRMEELNHQYGIVLDFIKGESLISVILNDLEQVSVYGRKMAELQAQIHHYSVNIPLPSQKTQLMDMIQAVDLLDSDIKEFILNHFHRLPVGTKICHADFHPENILIQNNECIVIDWANACLGHPLGDVARTVMIFQYASYSDSIPEEVQDLLDHIKGEICESYINRYCEITGYSKEDIEEWMLIIMAARLSENIPNVEKNKLLFEIKNRLKKDL